jgi:hypothetical protein
MKERYQYSDIDKFIKGTKLSGLLCRDGIFHVLSLLMGQLYGSILNSSANGIEKPDH